MSQIICYQHYIGELVMLIPVPTLAQDQMNENLANYGSPYGEHRQPYMKQGQPGVFIDVTTQTMIFADNGTRELQA